MDGKEIIVVIVSDNGIMDSPLKPSNQPVLNAVRFENSNPSSIVREKPITVVRAGIEMERRILIGAVGKLK
jgi:hypothetical protein